MFKMYQINIKMGPLGSVLGGIFVSPIIPGGLNADPYPNSQILGWGSRP